MGVVVAKVDQKCYARSSFLHILKFYQHLHNKYVYYKSIFLQKLYILFIPNTLLNTFNKVISIKFKIFIFKMV